MPMPNLDAPLFDATLRPHRSLTARQFKILIAATFCFTAAISLPFYLMGAWPIVGFFGLDVLAIYLAFRLNFRSARAYEHFRLTYFELLFARVSAVGDRREWRMTPSWVRLERVDDEDYGPQLLTLHSRGRSWRIAQGVGPEQKAEFADGFVRALAEARRGPNYS
jgi:uncharacterized membrane protein